MTSKEGENTEDRFDGTYPLIVIAPTSLLLPTIGRTACRLVNGLGTSLVALLILAPLFHVSAPWPAALSLIPLLALTTASSYCLMLFLGAVANYAPAGRNLIHNLATMSLMGFCGVTCQSAFGRDGFKESRSASHLPMGWPPSDSSLEGPTQVRFSALLHRSLRLPSDGCY